MASALDGLVTRVIGHVVVLVLLEEVSGVRRIRRLQKTLKNKALPVLFSEAAKVLLALDSNYVGDESVSITDGDSFQRPESRVNTIRIQDLII